MWTWNSPGAGSSIRLRTRRRGNRPGSPVSGRRHGHAGQRPGQPLRHDAGAAVKLHARRSRDRTIRAGEGHVDPDRGAEVVDPLVLAGAAEPADSVRPVSEQIPIPGRRGPGGEAGHVAPPVGLAKEADRHLAGPRQGFGLVCMSGSSAGRRRSGCPRPGPRGTPRGAGSIAGSRPVANGSSSRNAGRRPRPREAGACRRAQPWSGHSRNCRTWRSDTAAGGRVSRPRAALRRRADLEPVAERRVEPPDPLGGHHRIIAAVLREPLPQLLGLRARARPRAKRPVHRSLDLLMTPERLRPDPVVVQLPRVGRGPGAGSAPARAATAPAPRRSGRRGIRTRGRAARGCEASVSRNRYWSRSRGLTSPICFCVEREVERIGTVDGREQPFAQAADERDPERQGPHLQERRHRHAVDQVVPLGRGQSADGLANDLAGHAIADRPPADVALLQVVDHAQAVGQRTAARRHRRGRRRGTRRSAGRRTPTTRSASAGPSGRTGRRPPASGPARSSRAASAWASTGSSWGSRSAPSSGNARSSPHRGPVMNVPSTSRRSPCSQWNRSRSM